MDSHVHFLYKNIGYSEIGFSTFFTPPRTEARHFKPLGGQKWKKLGAHCFLKLLKIKKIAKSKFWFSTFFDPPPPEPNSRPKSAFYFMNFFLSGQNNMSPLKRNIQIQSPSLTDLTPTPLPRNIRVNWTPPYPSGGPKYIFWVGLCEIWPNKAKNQHNFALVG